MPLNTPGLARYWTDEDSPTGEVIRRFMAIYDAPDYLHRPVAEAAELYRLAIETQEPRILAGFGLADRFFLLTVLLQREDAIHPWIFARCREVEREPAGYLDLWPRGHYKSTLGTFAGVMQRILRNPDETVGIFSHTRPIAKGFLRQIKRELEQNAALQSLYADVLWSEPRKQSPKWSEDDGLLLKRDSNPKEATVEAWGLVDGQPTSKHYGLMVYDDVVTRESVTTPEMVAKTTEAWALSRNLTSTHTETWTIGTRYALADTYRDMIERGSVKVRRHRPVDAAGKPVLLTAEQLAEKRRDMGPYVYAAQMEQDPTADTSQGFDPDWPRYWRPAGWDGMNRLILVDPASSKKKGSDYTAMLVLGLGHDRNYYLIDMVRDRLNLAERTRTLFALHRDYSPRFVGYERYGKDSDIEHILEVQQQDNYRFEITELGGRVSKDDRIKSLVPLFEAGRIYLPESIIKINHEGRAVDLVRAFRDEEYLLFPYPLHDDLLDCLARINSPEVQIDFPRSPLPDTRPAWMRNLAGGLDGGSWMTQ